MNSSTLETVTTSNLLATETSSSNTSENQTNSSDSSKSALVNASEPSDGGGQTILKPQTDQETARNSSSGVAHGRAMNFDVQEEQRSGESQTAVTPEKGSLQDLSLDDIDETSILSTQIRDKINSTMPLPFLSNSSSTPVTSTEPPVSTTAANNYSDFTTVDGSSCVQGQKFNRGCSETCECGLNGKAVCRPRCSMPFFRRGALVNDPACIEKPSEDPCCSLLVCSHDTGNCNVTARDQTQHIVHKCNKQGTKQ